ncbi:uncharacterized protein [Drosophila pseudoobscura]|uniref:DUF4097 domain-containing protein n=1 Tax=Drosophila pseudoobscura pseudoobscura TaxID=46245 RepID=A0A6I8UVA6_DROPS|nr:uncharacterized protein LOC4804868 [Drosophila pseudoobscura]
MLFLPRVWIPQIRNQLRHYAKKSKSQIKPSMAVNNQVVHQELFRYVNPYARINVVSDLTVLVKSADVHQYTSGDVFIAQLQGCRPKNTKVTFDVNTSDDEKVVNVEVRNTAEKPSRFECHLQIPVRSDVFIEGGANVSVEGIQSECLQVKAEGAIVTKNVRATNISLYSENGNITCEGTLLGKSTEIETSNGNIELDKLQGDSLKCSTKGGNIITDCCYVEKSKFQTKTGRLELRNIHKTSEVHVHDSAELNMTGVHGNLQVATKGGSLNLQLSELMGQCSISADNLESDAVIHISDSIEKELNIEVTTASEVRLDDELAHVSHALSEDKSKFLLSNENQHHRLIVNSTGEKGVRLGKQSWSDMMRRKLQDIATENQN